jgi:ADP-ribosyl-[dinitrogen reductase] hydrolase
LNKYGNKFSKFNPSVEERNWNWKDENFTYSPYRAKKQPDYIGSYCMDALSMALHTVWHTQSFKECVLMNANMGGDCDTIGAIAGQICGGIYGIN